MNHPIFLYFFCQHKFRPYDHRVDTYVFGVICYEILTRNVYFSEQAIFSKGVINGELPLLTPFIQIIEDCWCQEPSKRPKFSLIIKKIKQLLPLHKEIDVIIQKYEEMLNEQQEKERDKEVDRMLVEEIMRRMLTNSDKKKNKKREKKSREKLLMHGKPLILWVDTNNQNYVVPLTNFFKKELFEYEFFSTIIELRSYLEDYEERFSPAEREARSIRIVLIRRDRRVDVNANFSGEDLYLWLKSQPRFAGVSLLLFCTKEKCKLQTDTTKLVWVTNDNTILLDFVAQP